MKQARTEEQKRERERRLVDAALALQRAERFDGWTISEVARRAGVAKGTVFLYFDTKEALGLAMVRRLLEEWFDGLDARLEAEGPEPTTAALAQVVARSLESRPELRQLLAIRAVRLEHNVSLADAETFRGWLLERVTRTGALLESRLGFLQQGEGVRLVLLIEALAVGFESVAEPAPAVAELLKRPRFAALRSEFTRSLSEALWMQLEGLRSVRRSRRVADSGAEKP